MFKYMMTDLVGVQQCTGLSSRGESILSQTEQVACRLTNRVNKVTKSKDGQDVSVSCEMRAFKDLALDSIVIDGILKYVILSKEQVRGLHGDACYYIYNLAYAR